MQKFRVRLKGFRFTAFVPPGAKVGAGDPVPVEWLKRKYAEPKNPAAPKARVAVGRQEHRDWLLVEAHSEAEAQGLFMKACGIDRTSNKFDVRLEQEPELAAVGASSEPSADAKPAKRGKKSADDLARDMLGDKVPAEE